MRNFYSALLLFLVVFAVSTGLAQAPSAPSNLHVEAGWDGGAILRWDTSSTAAFYKIYKEAGDSPFFEFATTDRHSFFDWAVGPGHEYHYFVRAFNESGGSDPSDTVEFHVFPPPPPPPVHGIIKGKITNDSTGMPIREAIVQFFNIHGMWSVRTHTDSGGTYRAALDTGRYYIRAEKFGFVPEWFDNVLRLDSATIVELHEDSVTADFGLRPLILPTPKTVSGTVTDSVSGAPLANAVVAFLRPHHAFRSLEFELGELGGFEFERFEIPELGFLNGVVGFALTDSSGHYTVHLLPYERYIALAFKPGYVLKFYKDKHTPFDADRIFVAGDTSGIDFALVHNPLAANTISGAVVDSTGLGIPSHVVLIRLTNHGPLPVRYRMTDSLGNYDFHNLVAGNFLVRAIPLNDYAPGWYSASICGVSSWKNADTLHLTGNLSGVDVCVVNAPSSGFASIGGYISNPSNVLAVSPSQGAVVYAVSNSTNQVVGYDVTEDDGSYSIDNIPPGTYHIVVDKEGYSATSAPIVTVDASNNYSESSASVGITPDVPLSVNDNNINVPGQYRLDQNYPNPFNPTTTIRYEIPQQSTVKLAVYNLIGQEIAVLSNATLHPGIYTTRWSGVDQHGVAVSSGLYFVKFAATPLDSKISSYVQVRKIMLMK